MYPVTPEFIDKMKADRRRVLARVEVDYTDPFLDQSIEIEASEQANVSYPQQTADSVDTATHKWASLDGSWVLDGTYHLAPAEDQLTQQQFGWWGAQLAGVGGAFAAPYPALTVTHLPRPIRQLKVVGDTARVEYPVDFSIRLYGPDDTLLKTETVTGNDQVSWSKTLDPQVLDVAKQVLEITKWSHAERQAKIIEFFTSIRETYETGDLVNLRLLEEREASQGSLPVGNISANEVTLTLNNESKKFDIDNEQSPLKNLLKPNRRIQAWLGAEAENAATENPPAFTRDSVAYQSDGTQVAANQPRFEQGKFGKAILIEEGTTNVFSYSTFNTTSTAGGWSHWGDTGHEGTYGQNTDPDFIFGNQNYSHWVANGAEATKGYLLYQSPSLEEPGGYSSLIVVCCMDDGSEVTNEKVYPSWNGRDGGAPNKEWTTIKRIGDTKFYECRVEGLCQDGTNDLIGFYVNPGYKVYFSRAHCERKQYSTSFTDGTRAAEELTIPTEGVLNPQEGTVECWVYVDGVVRRNIASIYPTVVLIRKGSSGAANWIWLQHNPAGTWLLQIRKEDGTVTGSGSFSDSLTPDGWHYFAIRWNTQEGTAELFHNGVKRISLANVIFPAGYDRIEIGHRSGSSNDCLNSLIDDLRISNRARTEEEILAAYQSNKPLQRDEDTTYLLTFNGSIYPVEMCWVPLGTFWSLDWDSPDDTLEATVTARDRMELLRKGTYQTAQVLQNKSLYELAEAVLQDAGLNSSEYIIDEALVDIAIPYSWFNPVSHREALRRIAEAGLAVAFQNRDGKIQIESFLITGDEPVLEITEDDYFPPLRAPSRQDQVANEIIVDTQPLRPAAVAEEVYRSNDPMTIPASTTKAITAFYNKTPVIEAIASLDSPPAGVSITEATYYGWGASVKIRNTNATDKQVTLVIQGKPLTVQNKERATARDETSITENGVLRFEFPANPLVQKLDQAQAIADALLASVKDPRRDIEVDWRGNPALLLGDRVTVKGQDYHVIRQEIEWAGALSARLTGRKVGS